MPLPMSPAQSAAQSPAQSPAQPPAARLLRRAVLVAVAALAMAPLLGASPAVASAASAPPPAAASAPPPAAAAAAAVTAVAVPTAVAAPVGRLTPRGCTGSGTVSCDLYADTGTIVVAGSSPIPIWGFAGSASGPFTAPGPQLVVNQGDTVTITVHNGLPAGQQLSLAFPGIPSSAFTTGLSEAKTQTGVGPGGTIDYTFTASRPGTFLYEAGHTADGSRQVAMGLVGALVVLPGDGTAYGSGASAYNDEQVAVLTEIDPVFNAAPTTFDMRSFRPTYRLINGNAYPEIPPVATDQGHTVLIRYLNAGAAQHAMSLLGGLQTAVARDGRELPYPEREVVASVEPGATEDVVTTMTTGPESKVTLYENGTHLDNAAQHTADPLQFAFGGMMTVLDTSAPAPSTDTVGPVSTHVTASPNPATGDTDVTITADVSDASTGGSTVDQAEFVVDDNADTGVGFGTAMTVAATADSATGTLTVATMATLAAGRHVIYVRAHDSAGNWGVVGSVVFNLPKNGPQTTAGRAAPAVSNQSGDITVTATGDDSDAGGNITAAELFVTADATPLLPPTVTNGSGIAMSLNRVATVVAETGKITPATNLPEGLHHAWVHSLDSLGLWGPLLDVPFTVDKTGPTVDGAAFAPNPTNGLISDQANPGYAVVSAKITDLDAGGALQSVLADAEAFLDPPSGPLNDGNGLQMIPSDGALDSTSETVYGLVPLSQVRSLSAGTHHMVVHGKDVAGNWGAGFVADFVVDKTAPVIGTPTASPNPTNGATLLTLTVPYSDASNTVGSAEFWLGSTDPGPGNGTVVTVSLSADFSSATVEIPLASIPSGMQVFNLRIRDKAGNWSNAVSTTVNVTQPPLLTSGFDNLTGWTVTNGAVVSVVPKPASVPAPMAGNVLQVAYPTTAVARQPAYVSRTLGGAQTTLHVQVDLFASGLATGGATPTILTVTTTPTGAVSAFSLQLRTTTVGTTQVKQVRTTLRTSGGGTVNGPWVTLPAGTVTVTLDWRAGPGTGATRGFLSMRFNSATTPVSTTFANTNTVQASGIRLGVIVGVTTAVRSNLYFDNLNVSQ
ncbi:MAG TPA: multicopper oxidase domain-containing protein [Dermatophilaceae bacterium]|nr:multicopper oxidase domain-containing protein [Dermatophilaceae bacterium]